MRTKSTKEKKPLGIFLFYGVDKDRRPKFIACQADNWKSDAMIAVLEEEQKKSLRKQGFEYLGMLKTDNKHFKEDSLEFLKIYEQLGVCKLPNEN